MQQRWQQLYRLWRRLYRFVDVKRNKRRCCSIVDYITVIDKQFKTTNSLKTKKMLHCTPFLLFDGNCAEAMTFYQKCLGGELTLTKLGDTPMKAQFPPEKHSRIINAQLKSGAIEFSATDWTASPTHSSQSKGTRLAYLLSVEHTMN